MANIEAAQEVVASQHSAKYELVRFARERQMDLIVVAKHGRHRISALPGSTADGVMHNAPCDVLAVRVSNSVGWHEPILENYFSRSSAWQKRRAPYRHFRASALARINISDINPDNPRAIRRSGSRDAETCHWNISPLYFEFQLENCRT